MADAATVHACEPGTISPSLNSFAATVALKVNAKAANNVPMIFVFNFISHLFDSYRVLFFLYFFLHFLFVIHRERCFPAGITGSRPGEASFCSGADQQVRSFGRRV